MQTSIEPEGSHAPASGQHCSWHPHWSLSAPRRRRVAAYKALHAEDAASLQGRRDLAQLLFDVERRALEAAAAAEAEQMAAADRRSMRLGPGTMREGDAGHGGLRTQLHRCWPRLHCAISATPCVSDRAGRGQERRGWARWAEHSCEALQAMCVPRRSVSQAERWGWGW